MPTYAVYENDVIVNAIVADSLEDAVGAAGENVVESIDGAPWIGWLKYEDGVWRLPQPYPSWIWNNNQWFPPVEKPEDIEHIWQWNEDNQEWDRSPLPQPYPSWLLDDNDIWAPPIMPPEDIYNYMWDEEKLEWVLRPTQND